MDEPLEDCIQHDLEDLLEVVEEILSHDTPASVIETLEGGDLRCVLNLLQTVRNRSPQFVELPSNNPHFQLRNRIIGHSNTYLNLLERWLKKLIEKVHVWSHYYCVKTYEHLQF